MISIVDYGMGNLRSVEKALQKLGYATELVSTPGCIDAASQLVLPGVGAFGDAMRGLQERSLVEPLRHYAASGRPLFGICLGMQILFESSEEDPGTEGLGILRGEVRHFPAMQLKVPHMGWNRLEVRTSSPWFQNLGPEPFVYFVHSYYVVPVDGGMTATATEYGIQFTSAVAHENVGGTQFHPEKSQATGLKILQNFASAGNSALANTAP
ncbi:MAG: imidazole glycerol phosphate synthase subunit HisH [Candidatus Sumerlaeaceae bacterium]